jgi:hypothetical protein
MRIYQPIPNLLPNIYLQGKIVNCIRGVPSFSRQTYPLNYQAISNYTAPSLSTSNPYASFSYPSVNSAPAISYFPNSSNFYHGQFTSTSNPYNFYSMPPIVNNCLSLPNYPTNFYSMPPIVNNCLSLPNYPTNFYSMPPISNWNLSINFVSNQTASKNNSGNAFPQPIISQPRTTRNVAEAETQTEDFNPQTPPILINTETQTEIGIYRIRENKDPIDPRKKSPPLPILVNAFKVLKLDKENNLSGVDQRYRYC